MKHDVLGVIETAYRLERASGREWLRDVGAAVYEQIGAGCGLLGFQYRVTHDGRLEVDEDVELDMPAGFGAMLRASFPQLPPEFVRTTFVRTEATTQSQGLTAASDGEAARAMMDGLAAFGWRDAFMIGGMDPSGHGVYLGLRRRLAEVGARPPENADAILTPGGSVDQAQGEAEPKQARAALRHAVLDVERARRDLRQSSPDRAVDVWKGLVSGRWTLVDHFQSDGKRYVLARRNDVAIDGFAALTERERQVVGYAALGHSNKLIAYEMGISSSTVGVLLHRAARKLGASDRIELIRMYAERG